MAHKSTKNSHYTTSSSLVSRKLIWILIKGKYVLHHFENNVWHWSDFHCVNINKLDDFAIIYVCVSSLSLTWDMCQNSLKQTSSWLLSGYNCRAACKFTGMGPKWEGWWWCSNCWWRWWWWWWWGGDVVEEVEEEGARHRAVTPAAWWFKLPAG